MAMKEPKWTLRYAAFVPYADDGSRVLRHGLARIFVNSFKFEDDEPANFGVACDNGRKFVCVDEDDILSRPHRAKGEIYAFGRSGEDALEMLHGFIVAEKTAIEHRLDAIDGELEAIETMKEWGAEKANAAKDDA